MGRLPGCIGLQRCLSVRSELLHLLVVQFVEVSCCLDLQVADMHLTMAVLLGKSHCRRASRGAANVVVSAVLKAAVAVSDIL